MQRGSIIALLFLAVTSLHAAPDGEALAEQKCTPCHLVTEITPERLKEMSAPPMWGVVKKIQSRFTAREEAVAFLIDYTMNPAKEKMLFPAETAERFGVMPSQQGNLSAEELRAIAEHLIP